jgi:RNA polymerase primary sigma factor
MPLQRRRPLSRRAAIKSGKFQVSAPPQPTLTEEVEYFPNLFPSLAVVDNLSRRFGVLSLHSPPHMGRSRSSASSPSAKPPSEASLQKQSNSKTPLSSLVTPRVGRNQLQVAAAAELLEQVRGLLKESPTLPQLIITKSPTKQAQMLGKLLHLQEQTQELTRTIETIKTKHMAPELRHTVQGLKRELREIKEKNDALIVRSNLLHGRSVAGVSEPPLLSRDAEHEIATQLGSFRAAFWEGLYCIPKVQQIRYDELNTYAAGEGRSQHILFSSKNENETPADLRKRLKRVLRKIDTICGARTLSSLSDGKRREVAKVLLKVPAPPERNVKLLNECKADQAVLSSLETKILCKHASIVEAVHKKAPSAADCRNLQRQLGGTALEVHEKMSRLTNLAESYLALKDYLVLCNKRLVYSIVTRSPKLNRYQDDLVQEGMMGLMRAIEKYDPSSGFKLATYATFWIKQITGRSFNSVSRLVDVPAHAIASFEELRTILSEPGALTDSRSLAQRTGLSEEDVETLIPLARPMQSLQTPTPLNESRELSSLIPDRKADDIDAGAIQSEARSIILESLRQLHPRLREVILLRFGLDGNERLTLVEIGEKLNLTRERIRQIEQKALQRLWQVSRRSNSKLSALAAVVGLKT